MWKPPSRRDSRGPGCGRHKPPLKAHLSLVAGDTGISFKVSTPGRTPGGAATTNFEISQPRTGCRYGHSGGSNVDVNNLVTPGIWAGAVVALLILLQVSNI